MLIKSMLIYQPNSINFILLMNLVWFNFVWSGCFHNLFSTFSIASSFFWCILAHVFVCCHNRTESQLLCCDFLKLSSSSLQRTALPLPYHSYSPPPSSWSSRPYWDASYDGLEACLRSIRNSGTGFPGWKIIYLIFSQI